MKQRRLSFNQGVIDSIPIWISFFFIFSSIGAIYSYHGYSLVFAVLNSALIFAAPLQIYFLENSFNSIFLIIAASLLINFRFMLMSHLVNLYSPRQASGNTSLNSISVQSPDFILTERLFFLRSAIIAIIDQCCSRVPNIVKRHFFIC